MKYSKMLEQVSGTNGDSKEWVVLDSHFPGLLFLSKEIRSKCIPGESVAKKRRHHKIQSIEGQG